MADLKSEYNASDIIVGVSGASGIILACKLLELARNEKVITHLIASNAARVVLNQESKISWDDFVALADHYYDINDIGAGPASGSFPVAGMVIVPCSVNRLSQIASGISSDLMSRAADVQLKERRKLLLAVRETPLHYGHIDSMARATRNGAIIFPPVPAYYLGQNCLAEAATQSAARMLGFFGIECECLMRWGYETSQ